MTKTCGIVKYLTKSVHFKPFSGINLAEICSLFRTSLAHYYLQEYISSIFLCISARISSLQILCPPSFKN